MNSFRTRARTVDMLGRQQIAGIPTAISELFKNAHDAYADKAVVDYFRSDRLFVLRDDGIGMTESDFDERWLVLGTDSKLGSGSGLHAPPVRDGYARRAVLGEKGIGRLAIATIGPQMLMLSRPVRDGKLGDLLVVYLHWGLFELPSANLEDVVVPTVTVPGGTLPDQDAVATLTGWVRENLDALARPGDQALAERVSSDLTGFRTFDPSALAGTLGIPSLIEGPGTHFYIRPASPLLAGELDEQDASPLRRMLVGFANTMTPGHEAPALRTAFRDHYTDDAYDDLIREADFFTPAEFERADHHIHGRFDEYGSFTGHVSVYGGPHDPYDVAWTGLRGKRTRCGPFGLDLAYAQGRQKDSRLAPDDFVELTAKLNLYGGLYIYRDGIRVLPYGNSDFDFLDVERQRAKSASDAFFSYRRMFGVIELTREHNAALREKAGREGFADNQAYRDFREILKHFLYQVVLDYFREAGTRAERWLNERAELNRLDRARQARAKQTRRRRSALTAGLDQFFDAVTAHQPEADVEHVLDRLRGRVAQALVADDPAIVAAELSAAEGDARRDTLNVAKAYQVTRPRGLGLTQQQSRNWLSYENERARLDEDVFAPALHTVEQLITDALRTAGSDPARRARFDQVIDAVATTAVDDVKTESRNVTRLADTRLDEVRSVARGALAEIEGVAQRTLAESARTDIGSMADSEFIAVRDRLANELAAASESQREILAGLRAQLEMLAIDGNPDGSYVDQVEALETDLEALREQVERDLELAQLGAAIEIINHEFDNLVRDIRSNLRRIQSWADANPALRQPYRDLRSSFEHLDGYLKLFTPLHRRLRRTKSEIAGAEIVKYVGDVFGRRLEDAGVELIATEAFNAHRCTQYPSVLYPVFVNLVDNALYWLTDYRSQRTITLDAGDGYMTVRDSGPGITTRDRGSIFDFGFSRKPGGSGYGLYISRQVLGREGWTIEVAPANPAHGAEFIIRESQESS